MLNVATTTAMPAKASSIVRNRPRKSVSTSRCCSAVSSAPVITSRSDAPGCAARVASHPRRQGVVVDLVGGAHEDRRDASALAGEQPLGRGEVEPDVARPVRGCRRRRTWRCRRPSPGRGSGVSTEVRSPTCRCAVRRWPGRSPPRCRCPSAVPGPRRGGSALSAGSSIQLAPRGGRAVAAQRHPVGPDELGRALDGRRGVGHAVDRRDDVGSRRVEQTADAVLGRAEAVGAAHDDVGAGVGVGVGVAGTRPWPCRRRSWSPSRKATPSTTAVHVASSRRLRLQMLWTMVVITAVTPGTASSGRARGRPTARPSRRRCGRRRGTARCRRGWRPPGRGSPSRWSGRGRRPRGA